MTRDNALKVAIWCIPVLFGVGSLHQTVLGSSADVAEVIVQLDEHEALPAHPVTAERMSVLLTEQRAMRTEQSAMRTEQAEQAQSLAAICQATGARCR